MKVEINNISKILTRDCPKCFLCGSEGRILYELLSDRLFGVPGTWNIMKCLKKECGLLWIDPMPIADEIEKLYVSYYTHGSINQNTQGNLVKKYLWLNAWRIYRALLRLTLIRRDRVKRKHMYLENLPPGKLLDVGCGAGQFLNVMKKKGWEVHGQDIDHKSAENALRTYGLWIDVGKLEDIAYPDNSFDAITLSHVIEHMHDPILLLSECRKILKAGGVLVIVAPNSESFGHSYFKSCYLCLDPPRHLSLYNQKNLRNVVKKAGFSNNSQTWTDSLDITYYSALGSIDLKNDGWHQMESTPRIIRAIYAMFFHLLSRIVLIFNNNSGEECILIVKK